MKKTLTIAFGLLIIASMVLAACQPQVQEVIKEVVVTEVVEKIVEGEVQTVVETKIVEIVVTPEPEVVEEPVTLYWNYATEPPTLDPSLATDTTSVDLDGNMFIGLTKFHPVTGDLTPYLATEWTAGEDADGNQTWTFTLREDVAWVNYDPTTGETTQEVDADGNPRFVNAFDVEYGVKRTVDPNTASDY